MASLSNLISALEQTTYSVGCEMNWPRSSIAQLATDMYKLGWLHSHSYFLRHPRPEM